MSALDTRSNFGINFIIAKNDEVDPWSRIVLYILLEARLAKGMARAIKRDYQRTSKSPF